MVLLTRVLSFCSKMAATPITLLPSTGGAPLQPQLGPILIRFNLHGHANRPFFHIVVTNTKVKNLKRKLPVVEQIGSYDPMPNTKNQKLVSLNVERMRYWMGQGATVSYPVARLMGLVGFLDIHPSTYADSWRTRFKQAKEAEENKLKESSSQTASSSSS